MRKLGTHIIAWALTLALVLPLIPAVYAASFSDIAASPYRESILSLSDRGIIAGIGNGKFNPNGILTNAEAATLLFRAFKLAPVYPVTTAAEEGKAPLVKEYYSTDTSVATLASVIMPGAPDAEGTWAFTTMNTVLESRLLAPAPMNSTLTRKAFATAVAKAVYGTDKKMDFLAQAAQDKLFPVGLELSDVSITRGEAARLLATALKDLNIISVFATSDIHGNMVPYKPSGSVVPVAGSAKTAYIINEMRKRQQNLLLVDAGDSPYNTDIANNFLGKSSVDVMNATGYDATVLGNHDFDYSFENLLGLAEQAEYAMLSANTYWKDETYPKQFKPYILKESGGLKVAIVGLTDDGSKLTTHYTNTQDIIFKDQWEVGKEVIAKADAEADVVILLSHLHGGNNSVPTKIKGVDLEIGGGNDIFGRPTLIGDTIVVNPGGVGASLNQVNLNMRGNKLLGYTFNQLILTSEVPEDQTVKNILDNYKVKLDEGMKKVIGKSSAEFPWSSSIVRTAEAALGNLAADALLSYSEADVAIQNGGGLRAALPAGDITLGDIFKLAPFDNRVVLLEVTGADLWAALENGVSGYPETNGKFPQVSGLKYTFDGAKPAGERIVSVTMSDGKPLDLKKTYRVACNNFMAGGGDGYTTLNVLNKDAEMNPNAKLIYETNDYYRNVLADYVAKLGSITPSIEGRITILNPKSNDQKLN